MAHHPPLPATPEALALRARHARSTSARSRCSRRSAWRWRWRSRGAAQAPPWTRAWVGVARARPRQRARGGARAAHRPPLRQAAAAAAARPARRRARAGAHHGDRADPALVGRGRPGAGRAPRGARARQRGPARSTSRCSPTSPTRPPSTCPARTRRSRRRSRGSRPSTRATPRTPRTASTCSTARAAGTRARACGWAGSASAARSRSSTGCCAAPPTPASPCRSGAPEILPQVRYCITLDSDTRLPRDAARQLIGVIEHPLNRPRFDPALRRVVEGYGILQPRVSVTMASAAGSLFARVYAGHTGVDPYTTAVSDTYQDLFGEGSFTGKGLYDVDAFTAALEGRVPENAMLSHDLFEGPVRALRAGVGRRAGGRLPLERARPRAAPAPLGARRLADPAVAAAAWCRRRTASSAAGCRSSAAGRSSTTCAAAWWRRRWWRCSVSAWTWLPGSPLGWTLAALAVLGFPLLPPARPPRAAARARSSRSACSCATSGRSSRPRGAQVLLEITLLAYHAYEMLHAIVLTLVRMVFTQRRLLEWETAAAGAARAAGLLSRRGLRVFLAEMWAGPAAALVGAAGGAAAARRRAAGGAAVPGRVAGLAGGRVVAEPAGGAAAPGARQAEDAAQLRRIARRTWHYFERFVTAEDHWLPPDNVQETPEPAHRPPHLADQHRHGAALDARRARPGLPGHRRSSRTGSRTRSPPSRRSSATRGTCSTGTTRTSLAPLAPRYVSTVDSGNLAGALMALAAGLRELARARRRTTQRLCAGAARHRGRARRRAGGAGARRRTRPRRCAGAAAPRCANWTRCARRSPAPDRRSRGCEDGAPDAVGPARRARAGRGGPRRPGPKPTRSPSGAGRCDEALGRCRRSAAAPDDLLRAPRATSPTAATRLADAHGLEVPLRPRSAGSSRSASGSPTPRARAASTPRTTTCSRRRRGSRASSRSRAATCRRSTGSGSRARW